MRSRPAIALLALLTLSVGALLLSPRTLRAQQEATADKALINRTLDSFHQAAARADGKAYFAHFDEKAIFLGTDASERWTLDLFHIYADKRFAEGKGWTYTPTYRSIYVSADRTVAWFDELLHNEKYGTCRGTGVMLNNGAAWLITQYNLSVPIPNELLPKVAEMIDAFEAAPADAVKAEDGKTRAAEPAPAPAPKP